MNTEFSNLPPEDVYATSKKIRFVLERLKLLRARMGRPLRVLDFGCGNATQLGQFVINNIDEYVGIDIHAPSLEYARRKFSAKGARFLEAVPRGETFDAILFSEVLEHLDDPSGTLREYLSFLAQGGEVIASIPNGYGLTEIEKYIDRKLSLYNAMRWPLRFFRKLTGRTTKDRTQSGAPYNVDSGHVQFFTQRKLARTARDAGLRIAELKNGSLMGADLSGATVLRFRPLITLNTKIAGVIPHWAAATWHFVLVRDGADD